MEFLHIYLLITAAFASLCAILITRIINKETILRGENPTFIQNYIGNLSYKLERGRTGITIQQYFAFQLGCPALLAFGAYFISDDRTLMLIFVLLGFLMPSMYINLQKESEDKKFEDRFVRALSQLASSLHSGMTVEQAIDSVVNCELLNPAIREDFQILSSKLKLGMPISDAFFDFAKMTNNKDAYDVATAIIIMTDVGGDAGVAIEKLQKNIEDRLLYRRKRESMMTESKIIALFADIVPIIILAGTYIMMPDTIAAYFETPMMTAVFIIVIVILLVGSIVVHKMLGNKLDAS